MKEIKSIISTYDTLKSTETRFALATVVHVEDSSYRRSGARMLISEDGNWTGGISGGCLEGDTLKKAQFVIYNNTSTAVRYDTREDDPNQIGVGLGCNGLIDVLITPLTSENNQIEKLRKCSSERQVSIMITVVEDSEKALSIGSLWHSDELDSESGFVDFKQDIEEDLKQISILKKSKSIIYKNESRALKLFLEFIPPSIQLLIFGKHYDTVPLVKIGKEIGWDVSMIANPNKLSKALYKEVDNVCNLESAINMIDDYTAALLMSHDFKTDKEHYKALLSTDTPYIGLLGPTKRTEKLCLELESEGYIIKTDNLFAPIGLDTGATSPDEIAISMIAEIRTYFSGRAGGFLRDREGPINE